MKHLKQSWLSAFILSLCWAATAAEATLAQAQSSTFGSCSASSSIIVANLCPGPSLGLKVNRADALLGENPGEIWVYGGGRWGNETARSTISSHHILRLFPGTYTSTGSFGYILLKDNSALICEDPSTTILQEPTHTFAPKTDLWGIVKAHGVSTCAVGPCEGSELGIPNQNITVRGCRFKGARSDFSEGATALALGNCHHCDVSGNVFENMHSIAFSYGYIAAEGRDPLGLGKYAEGSSFRDNLLIQGNAANVAVTNGQNITIANNTFLRPGQKDGSFPIAIDIEPNNAADRALAISIVGNIVDFHGSEAIGDAIAISNYHGVAPSYFGQILISGNTFRGGLDSTAANSRQLRTALLVKSNVYDVTFINNVVRFARNSGVYVDGARIHVEGNSIFGNGDPKEGYYAILFDAASRDSSAANNRLYCNRNLTSDCSMQIQNKGAASNQILGNLFYDAEK